MKLSSVPLLILAALTLAACQRADYNWGWYEILPSTEKGAGNLRFLFSGVWLSSTAPAWLSADSPGSILIHQVDVVNWGAVSRTLPENKYDFILTARSIHGWMQDKPGTVEATFLILLIVVVLGPAMIHLINELGGI